jgi:hypothetical protein
MRDRPGLAALDPETPARHELSVDSSRAKKCEQVVDSRQSAPKLLFRNALVGLFPSRMYMSAIT